MNYSLADLRRRAPKKSEVRIMASTGLALARTICSHPARFVKFRTMGLYEQRFVRPLRKYEIPPFDGRKKHPLSTERYLRPTRYCNPREAEVVAMANALGAFELADREFAEAAYRFVKDNINFEMRPVDGAAATLRRGTGACFHFASLFIALCRAAGIKARYKIFAINYDRYVEDVLEKNRGISGERDDLDTAFEDLYNTYMETGIDPTLKDLYDALGYLMFEAETEVFLNDSWVVAYPAANDELLALRNLPISKLGEDPIGVFYDAVPGTIQHLESLPLGMSAGMNLLFRLMPGSPERLSIFTQRTAELGRKIIEEAGGKDAYDKKARERLQLSTPTIEPTDNKALVFVE